MGTLVLRVSHSPWAEADAAESQALTPSSPFLSAHILKGCSPDLCQTCPSWINMLGFKEFLSLTTLSPSLPSTNTYRMYLCLLPAVVLDIKPLCGFSVRLISWSSAKLILNNSSSAPFLAMFFAHWNFPNPMCPFLVMVLCLAPSAGF